MEQRDDTIMAVKLKGAVAVITGASSGIGRATALKFASKGTTVVVAARREEALNDLVSEIERSGGRALAVPTDVSDEQAVQRLAEQAVQTFGKIDIWVNNAGVLLYGSVTDVPMTDVRRLMEINFIGQMHGARAALPVFRAQGSGTLIDVSSVVTRMPQPYSSAYVASKHAVQALGQVLRQELLLAGEKNIHVVNVLPAVIDTPIFQSAGNYTGRQPKAPPPVYPAKDVADAIVRAAINPQRNVYAGRAGLMANLQAKVMPGAVERSAAQLVDKGGFEDTPTSPSSGNLFAPAASNADVSGGWKASGPSKARRLATVGAVAVPVATLAQGLWKRQQMIAEAEANRGLKAKVSNTSLVQRLAAVGVTAVPLVAAFAQRALKRKGESAQTDQGVRRVRVEAPPAPQVAPAPQVEPAPEVETVTETITITDTTNEQT